MEPTNKPGATQPNTVEVAKGFKVGNHPAGIYLLKVNNKKILKCFHMSNIFKVNNRHQNDANDVILVSVLLTLNISHTLL